jgi:hypothetical protein
VPTAVGTSELDVLPAFALEAADGIAVLVSTTEDTGSEEMPREKV